MSSSFNEIMKQIVVRWIKNVAWQRRLPQHQIDSTNATVIAYGSYGLGVILFLKLCFFKSLIYCFSNESEMNFPVD